MNGVKSNQINHNKCNLKTNLFHPDVALHIQVGSMLAYWKQEKGKAAGLRAGVE